MGKVLAIGGIDLCKPGRSLIMEKISALVGDGANRKMVYLPTAQRDSGRDEAFIREYFGSLGFAAKPLYLTDAGLSDAYIRDTILGADMIYASGGNLKFLMETWRARKADVYLRQAYEQGTVLAGTSSGAMCWFRRGYDDCGIGGRPMFIEGVGLFPYCLCPHFENENWHKFTDAVQMQELDGLGVDDDAALVFCDGKVSILRNYPDKEAGAYLMRAKEDYRLQDLSQFEDEFFL